MAQHHGIPHYGHIEEKTLIDISMLSSEDRALYDRCLIHGVDYEASPDPRNETLAEREKRHTSIRNRIKKKLGAERQRKRRQSLSEEARKEQRQKDALRQRLRRAVMSEVAKKEQRKRDAERQRHRRSAQTFEERDRQRKRDKERQRKRRARLALAKIATPTTSLVSLKEDPGDHGSSLPLGSGTVHHLRTSEVGNEIAHNQNNNVHRSNIESTTRQVEEHVPTDHFVKETWGDI